MKIQNYEFGRVKIDGETYNNDVIILPDRVVPDWWRKSGHEVHIEDIEEILRAAPEVLIVGTGYYDLLKVLGDTEEKLAEFGLTQPLMKITLTLEDGDVLNIRVGDETPDGHAFYVQAPDSNDVALVDYTWYEVLERLVTEPPYAPPEED